MEDAWWWGQTSPNFALFLSTIRLGDRVEQKQINWWCTNCTHLFAVLFPSRPNLCCQRPSIIQWNKSRKTLSRWSIRFRPGVSRIYFHSNRWNCIPSQIDTNLTIRLFWRSLESKTNCWRLTDKGSSSGLIIKLVKLDFILLRLFFKFIDQKGKCKSEI